MSKLSNVFNQYFIEMVKDPDAKNALIERYAMDVESRAASPMPITKSMSDAFYVVLGCKFQDNPIQILLLGLAFIVVIGLSSANFIRSFLH